MSDITADTPIGEVIEQLKDFAIRNRYMDIQLVIEPDGLFTLMEPEYAPADDPERDAGELSGFTEKCTATGFEELSEMLAETA